MFRISLFGLALSLCIGIKAQQTIVHVAGDPGGIPREHGLDFLELKLDVDFLPDSGLVWGTVLHQFKAKRLGLTEAFLDAPGIQILDLSLDGKSFPFEQDAKGIYLKFNQPPDTSSLHQLLIRYRAKPIKGLYFIGWDDPSGRCRKQIWTQGQGIDNRHWIPMYDGQNDKVISDITVRFQEGFEVVSNGQLLSKKKLPQGNIEWHYRMPQPHATYLIMLGIGNYGILNKSAASGVPMKLLFYPEKPEQAEPTYRFSVEMFDFFEKEIGYPYPWGNYCQVPVQDFMYGAMENTTATIFGDFFLVDESGYKDRNYVAVNAHELAHQWFGDLVTARSLKHHWLQESFATFYNMLFEREAFGDDHYHWKRHLAAQAALEASNRDLLPIAHSEAGTARYYPKGAVVLHMLREFTGRENYNKAIRMYLNRHAFGNVDSDDLLSAFQDALGFPLDAFWNQWVYKGGEPHFSVEAKAFGDGQTQRNLVFTVRQTQEISPLNSIFDVPMRFEAYFEDGTLVSTQARIHQTEQSVVLPLPDNKKLMFWLADPNRNILGSMEQKQPLTHFEAMLQQAKGVLDRFYALTQLEALNFEQRLPLLQQVVRNPKEFHAVKAEALRQLKPNLKDERVLTLFELALQDKDQEVRKAAVEHLDFIPQNLTKALEAQFTLDHASYELQEKTLRKLCAFWPQNAQQWISASGTASGNRGNQLAIARLEMQVAHGVDAELALSALQDFTSPAWEFISRTNAWAALRRLDVLNESMLNNAPQALAHANRRLAAPVRETLKSFCAEHQHQILVSRWLQKNPEHTPLFEGILNQ